MNFSEYIREKRKMLGLKQSELGIILGVTAQTIRNWEFGKPPRGLTRDGVIARLNACKTKKSLVEEINDHVKNPIVREAFVKTWS